MKRGQKCCSDACRRIAVFPQWTERTLLILKENYSSSSKKEILQLLSGFTNRRIRTKAGKLGLQKSSGAIKRSLSDRVPWNKNKKGVMPTPWNKDTKGIMVAWNKGTKGLMPAPWSTGLTKETDERIRKMAEAKKGEKNPVHKPGVRDKIAKTLEGRFVGKDNPAYIDGRSYEVYSKEFIALREIVRERDSLKCQMCSVPERECERKLEVHHIDGNPKNNLRKNLISLCKKCHLETRGDRRFWEIILSQLTKIKEVV